MSFLAGVHCLRPLIIVSYCTRTICNDSFLCSLMRYGDAVMLVLFSVLNRAVNVIFSYISQQEKNTRDIDDDDGAQE